MSANLDPGLLPECRIYEGEESARRLKAMGLKESFFIDAAIRGHERRAPRCGPHYPKGYGGQVMWAETLAALRGKVLDEQDGWDISRKRGYETAFNAKRRIAIAVVGGDENTGVEGIEHPMTARPRGPMTNKRVQHNRHIGQLSLPGMPVPEGRPITDEDCVTWFFLINAREDRIYSELSLPIVMGSRKRIDSWAERILLSSLELVGAVTPIEPREESNERTVHVGRKPSV